MIRGALALAVPLIIGGCGSSGVLERSAPERPAWVELTPDARDSLYFVGICTDLPSYQEALRCARGEALTDVAAWVGARFSAYVYSQQGEESRSGGSSIYLDADLFLTDVRRSDTYYEVTETEYGTRSYLVSVLLAYSRREAETEQAQIEETTRRAEQLVDEIGGRVYSAVEESRWGDAMDILLGTAGQVVVPRNLRRAHHSAELAGLVDELVAPFYLTAESTGPQVEARAVYKDAPAAGAPLHCFSKAEDTFVRTEADGSALCGIEAPPRGETVRMIVRPDITGYLGWLLETAVHVEVGALLDVELALSGGEECLPALDALRERLEGAGVRLSDSSESIPGLAVSCDVEEAASQGDLFTTMARGSVTLRTEDRQASGATITVHGLGATQSAATEDAAAALGRELATSTLKLLREPDA